MERDTDRDSLAGPGTQPTLPVALSGEPIAAGTLIGGRYRLVRWLGRGGMGSVYEVEDCELGVRVALKMAEGTGWDASAVAQLKREIQLARRVTHPNVCRVHDFGTHVLDGVSAPFLTMELIAGRTLSAELASEGRFDPDRTLAIAEPMAAALDAAHAAGVVHRDFKSGNVMIARDRTVVTDFGLAVDASFDSTAEIRCLVGSPAYMAPEQVEGRPITVATDVYAFGVVLYELLTGRVPFAGAGPLEIALSRLRVPPPPLRELVPELPERWEEAVLRCLRVPPHERFETCADVVRELRASRSRAQPALDHGAGERSIALVLAQRSRDPRAFAEAVAERGGTLVALDGDSMAAVFGAEQSLGDEIDRALATAHAADEAAERVALAVGHGSLRSGVLAGEAIREAQVACERGAGGVLAGARTAALVSTRCEVVETEPGLFALGPRRQIASVALVGREAELSSLRRARDAVLAESRMLATWIVGPPGIGKSRLAEAAIALALEAEMSVSSARANAHHPRAYGLFARPSDAATEASRAARLVGADDHSLGRSIETLGRGADARAISDRVRARAIARLKQLASTGPCALVLDDLQWADPSSLALLAELAGVLADVPVWLVLVARDELEEAEPGLLEAFDTTGRIQPAALRAADVIELARMRTGCAPRPAMAQALTDRTGGSPLFVEQLLDVMDPGALAGAAIDEWPLPATVEHAVQARLDRLPPAERECVMLLALHRRPATAAELDALARREGRLGPTSMKEALAALARRGLVTRAANEGPGAHRLRSVVVGEVAYRMVDEARRRRLHQIAAELGAEGGRDAEEVALHLAAAGDERRAAASYARATLANAARGDSRGVLRCGERALGLGLDPEQAFAVHFARAEAARFVDDAAVQHALLEQAWQAARTDRERALCASEEAEWLRRNRRASEALAQLRRAIELAEASGDGETRARAVARMASALITVGRAGEASEALRQLDDEGLGPATRAMVEDVRGWLAGSTGDYGAVRAAYARAAALYAEAGDLRRAAGAESNLADADNRLGRYDEARGALRRALEHARAVGNRLTEGYALMNLGYALSEGGDGAGALALLEEARAVGRAIGDTHLELGARLYAARARLAIGDVEPLPGELEAIARDAAGEPTLEANAWALAARACLASPDAGRACDAALRALAIRDASGTIEEGEGEVFWAAVLALEAAGRGELAASVRARGRARIDELAARITDPDARRSFLERIPAHRFFV